MAKGGTTGKGVVKRNSGTTTQGATGVTGSPRARASITTPAMANFHPLTQSAPPKPKPSSKPNTHPIQRR